MKFKILKKMQLNFHKIMKSYFNQKMNVFKNQKTVRNLFSCFILIAHFDASFKGKHQNFDRHGYFG